MTTEDEPVMPSVILRTNLLLRAIVHEQIRIWLYPTEYTLDCKAILPSDVQDFVAESGLS